MQKYNVQAVTAASAAKVGITGERRLMGFAIYPAAANSTVEFKNAATDTGDVLLTYATLANTAQFVDLSDLGGITFSTAMFCKPAGTGCIVYVWYE